MDNLQEILTGQIKIKEKQEDQFLPPKVDAKSERDKRRKISQGIDEPFQNFNNNSRDNSQSQNITGQLL